MQTSAIAASLAAPTTAPPVTPSGDAGPDEFSRHLSAEEGEGVSEDTPAPGPADTSAVLLVGHFSQLRAFRSPDGPDGLPEAAVGYPSGPAEPLPGEDDLVTSTFIDRTSLPLHPLASQGWQPGQDAQPDVRPGFSTSSLKASGADSAPMAEPDIAAPFRANAALPDGTSADDAGSLEAGPTLKGAVNAVPASPETAVNIPEMPVEGLPGEVSMAGLKDSPGDPLQAVRSIKPVERQPDTSPDATDFGNQPLAESAMRAVTEKPVPGLALWNARFDGLADAAGVDADLSEPSASTPQGPTPLLRGELSDHRQVGMPFVVPFVSKTPLDTQTRNVWMETLAVSGLALDASLQETGFALTAPPGSLATAPAALPTALAQGALPQLAAQIGAMLAQRSDGATEFTLSPEELGHVRITLQPETPSSDRVIVMLSFDRPETLDLFRRHADQLSAALQAAGYSGSSLGFAQSDRGGDTHAGAGEGRAPDASDDQSIPPPTPRAANGALDLRL